MNPNRSVDIAKQQAIARQIKERRVHLRISQKAIAEAVGIDVKTLRKVESGLQPLKFELRAKLASALSVSAEYLFDSPFASSPTPEMSILIGRAALSARLVGLLNNSSSLSILRCASFWGTTKDTLVEFRRDVSRRLKEKTLRVQTAEAIRCPERWYELLGNVRRYDGAAYEVHVYDWNGWRGEGFRRVKTGIGPGFDAFIFDHATIVLSGILAPEVPDQSISSLTLSGGPLHEFIWTYWHLMWSRGTKLDLEFGKRFATSAFGHSSELSGGSAPFFPYWNKMLEDSLDDHIGDGVPALP